MRAYLAGPSIGPFRTVLWSSRTRRRTQARRRPWWPRRFTSLRYWVLGIWALEMTYWALYGLVMAAQWAWHHYKRGTT